MGRYGTQPERREGGFGDSGSLDGQARLAGGLNGDEEVPAPRRNCIIGPRVLKRIFVCLLRGAQFLAARNAENRRRVPVLYHLDLSHASLDALISRHIEATVVTLNETDPTVRLLPAEAVKVHELIPLNRLPAARVLPAADLHNDIHDIHGKRFSAHAQQLVEWVCSVTHARLSP